MDSDGYALILRDDSITRSAGFLLGDDVLLSARTMDCNGRKM
jgi:hypothetical protein